MRYSNLNGLAIFGVVLFIITSILIFSTPAEGYGACNPSSGNACRPSTPSPPSAPPSAPPSPTKEELAKPIKVCPDGYEKTLLRTAQPYGSGNKIEMWGCAKKKNDGTTDKEDIALEVYSCLDKDWLYDPLIKKCYDKTSPPQGSRPSMGGRVIGEELCENIKNVDPQDYETCVSSVANDVSPCLSSNDSQAALNCVKERVSKSDRTKINEGLINKALEKAHPKPKNQADSDPTEPTCTIDGIGWLLCPVMNFVAGVNDALFSMVSGFLTVDKKMFDTSGDYAGTFKAWSLFRNIANSLFVVIFLVVIFSQITGAGLSNYNIKQMMPRIIMASIFINLSFIICQVAVDLSNILGTTLKDFLTNIAGSSQGGAGADSGWIGMMGTILVGGGATIAVAAMALYAIGIPGAVAFFVAILMTTMILIGRQAGIILLTTISPLAFAAWILPNTEKWFKQWRKMFTGLLVVFPIISLLFGAGTFAGTIIGDSSNATMKVAALVVTALPLFAAPSLMRKSMDSLGTIGQMAGSLSGKFSGKAKEAASNSNFVKHRERIAAQRKAQIQSGTYKENFGKFDPRRLRNLRSRVNAARNQSGIFNKITGNYGERMSVLGASVAAGQDKETMEAANASVSAMNLDSAGLMQLIRTGKDGSGKKITEHQRRAAVQQLTPMMTGNEARGLASLSTRLDTDMRKEIASAVRTASTKAPWLGGKSLSDIQAGTYNEDAAMDSYIQEKLSAEDFNTMDAASIDALNQRAIVQARMGNGALLFNLRGTKVVHSQSNELTSKISASNRSALRRIS